MALSYSQKTKRALAQLKLGTGGQIRAEFSALISTCGSLHIDSGGLRLELVGENDLLKERVDAMLLALYGLDETDKRTEKQFTREMTVIQISYGLTARLLADCRIMSDGSLTDGIDASLVDSTDDKRSFMRGAFIGGGTLHFGAGYLLEFNFSRERIAEDFCDILNSLEICARIVERNNRFVVYLKDGQDICDVMAHIGATRAVTDIQSTRAERMMNAKISRERNCDVSNAGRAVQAAVETVRNIRQVEATRGLDSLDPKLAVVARARMEDPYATLSDLATQLGITKSCLRHRLSKIESMAKTLSDDQQT